MHEIFKKFGSETFDPPTSVYDKFNIATGLLSQRGDHLLLKIKEVKGTEGWICCVDKELVNYFNLGIDRVLIRRYFH